MRDLTFWNENRTSPWRGLMELQRNLDRLFDQVWNPSSESVTDEVIFRPSCDIEETESHYLMSFDLPGVSKKDISIEVRDNQLIVSGERKHQREGRREGGFFSERAHGKFQRVLTLPGDVDAEKIEARYHDGVLELAVPKAASAQARKIEIHEGKEPFFARMAGGEQKESKRLENRKQTQAA